MADIDDKRIIGVSDGNNTMPVYWGLAAKEIKQNNAIIMGISMARSIDKTNLWNGTLYFTEKAKGLSVEPYNVQLAELSDTLVAAPQNGIQKVFTESYTALVVEDYDVTLVELAVILPCTATNVYNDGDNVIYVEMQNPITSDNISANINAFEITAIFGGITYTVNPTNVTLTGLNTIKLDCNDFSQATGNINVLYKNEIGNLYDNFNGVYVSAFNISFAYTTTYSEGE